MLFLGFPFKRPIGHFKNKKPFLGVRKTSILRVLDGKEFLPDVEVLLPLIRLEISSYIH